jgi:high-affinity Fe2+/Pb2+ permease
MKVRLLPVFLVIVLLTPFVVAAQANPCTGGAAGNIGQCVSQIYLWSLGLSALLAVVMSIFGGYYIMSARGNGAQATKGKEFIYSSLIGMVLLLAAYLLLNTINPDLTNFSVEGSLPPSSDAKPAPPTGTP